MPWATATITNSAISSAPKATEPMRFPTELRPEAG